MVFKIKSVKQYFNDKEKIKYEELGFKFSLQSCRYDWIISNNDPLININSLEQLMYFIEKWGEIIIDNENIKIFNDFL
jgi:hypothetical protein